MSKNKLELKEIGTVSHRTNTQKLIVPTRNTPPIGITVVNRKNRAVGRINDIIGSTKSPYISIKTSDKYHPINEGEKVFLSPKKNKRRKKHGRNSKKKKTFRQTQKINQEN